MGLRVPDIVVYITAAYPSRLHLETCTTVAYRLTGKTIFLRDCLKSLDAMAVRPGSASLLYDAKFVLLHENTVPMFRRWHMAQQPSAA